LFVSARYVDLPLYKTLLTLFLDIAVNTLMTLPRTQSLRTWYMFDELGALHRLPAIENGLQTARGFGGAMVLGLHSFARLQAVYGREGAENMASLTGSKLILKTGDRKTAEACAEFIGHREVRQMDEAYSYGNNPLRDGATITPKKEIAPLVIPDDITNLPSLHGFVKFPDGFPAARIELMWHAYPDVARGFEPRKPLAAPQRDTSNPLANQTQTRAGGGGDGGGPEDQPVKEEIEPKRLIGGDLRGAFAVNERRALAALAAQTLAKQGETDPERADLEQARLAAPAEMTAAAASEAANEDATASKAAQDRAGKPGSIERRDIANIDERQAAMQRALNSEFGISDDTGNEIEID
jgi:hypothetical protein